MPAYYLSLGPTSRELEGRFRIYRATHGAAARGSEGEALEGGKASLVVNVRAREEREHLSRAERTQADRALCEASHPGRRLDACPIHGTTCSQREDCAGGGDAAIDLREEIVERIMLGIELAHQLVCQRAQPVLAPRAPRRGVGAA